MKALYVALCVLTTVSSAAAQDLVIANARIIVANGTVIDNGSIIVRGGRITSVSAGAPPSSAGLRIDGRGLTAMPGFIDAHRHFNTGPMEKEQMQAQLEAGYTTICFKPSQYADDPAQVGRLCRQLVGSFGA